LFPYGDYLEPGKFPQLSASSVMSIDNSLLRENVAGKLVLIGSNWHRLAWGTGPLNDSHLTPVGSISGVFVHANYAEAILETDYHRQPPDWFADAVEGLVLLSMAVLFAGKMNSWKKMAVVVSATFLFITLGYMLLQNLGIYFDFLIPLVFLMLHVLADKVLEWRRIALAREKEPQLA